MLAHRVTVHIDKATQGREDKSESKAANLQAKADAEGVLQDTKLAKAGVDKYSADLSLDGMLYTVSCCNEKAISEEMWSDSIVRASWMEKAAT